MFTKIYRGYTVVEFHGENGAHGFEIFDREGALIETVSTLSEVRAVIDEWLDAR